MAKGPLAAPDGCTYWSIGHLCDRMGLHCGDCVCKCGDRFTGTAAAAATASVLAVQPSDVVALVAKHQLSEQECDHLTLKLKAAFPDNRVVVTDQAALTVVRLEVADQIEEGRTP